MAKQGWISLHRQIQQNWIWKKSKVKSELEAWLDILMEVNHAKERVSIKGVLIDCERSESIKSLDTWAERWGWNKSKVRRFFDLLQKDSMIELKPCTITTHLKVLNYDTYNGKRNTDETEMKRKRNADETELTPNNNDNNEENEKKEDLSPVGDYIDTLISDFCLAYIKGKGVPYKVIKGKDRKGMGGILAYYKANNKSGEDARTGLSKIFNHILSFNFATDFLNQVTICKLNSNFNEYITAIKQPKGFNPADNQATVDAFKKQLV